VYHCKKSITQIITGPPGTIILVVKQKKQGGFAFMKVAKTKKGNRRSRGILGITVELTSTRVHKKKEKATGYKQKAGGGTRRKTIPPSPSNMKDYEMLYIETKIQDTGGRRSLLEPQKTTYIRKYNRLKGKEKRRWAPSHIMENP